MKYKLVVIDMDGTLLNSEHNISKRNMEAIYKAMEKGVRVVLATGRMPASAWYYARTIRLDNPIIACNGAIISSKGGNNTIYERKLEFNTSRQMVELAHRYEINYRFCGKDTFYAKMLTRDLEEFYPSYRENLAKQGIEIKILEDVLETIIKENLDIYKFEFVEENEDKLLSFRKELSSLEGINMASSWHNNVEVMNEGTSKGSALEYLCYKYNIENSQVMTIGDNENDISMFKISGLAIAMENGSKIAKQHSHAITHTNDEDGVAKAIEKYILS